MHTIPQLVRRCLQSFSELENTSPFEDQEDGTRQTVETEAIIGPRSLTFDTVMKLKDGHARFRLWAGNIGAHRTGFSSLSYRLRDSSHIHNQVLKLLEELHQALLEAEGVLAECRDAPPEPEVGARMDGDTEELGFDDTQGPFEELGQIAIEIMDIIDCLLRLSMTIRNPAPHDRFFNTKETDTTHFEEFDIQHVQAKFQAVEPWLAERLGRAISRRRQYLRYREAHHQKLAQHLDDDVENEVDETVASSLPEHLKDSGEPRDDSKRDVIMDDGISDAGVSDTSYATSRAAEGDLCVPPLPKEAEGVLFECPLCYMIINVSNRISWKKHVYGDLRPYVCLESKYDLENFQFTKRREWISHVMSSHWRVFRCSFGCQESFASAEECEIHLESKHLTSIQKGGLESLAKQSSRPMDFSRGMECPLCRVQIGSFPLYKRHVGRHQEQMALFALPTQEAQDQDIDEDDNESLGSSNGSDEQGGSTDTSRQRASIIEHLESIGREEARRARSSQPLLLP